MRTLIAIGMLGALGLLAYAFPSPSENWDRTSALAVSFGQALGEAIQCKRGGSSRIPADIALLRRVLRNESSNGIEFQGALLRFQMGMRTGAQATESGRGDCTSAGDALRMLEIKYRDGYS